MISGAFVEQAFASHIAAVNFMQYAALHNKVYETTEEFMQRLSLFNASLEKIEEQNSSNSTWTAGLNHMSDWTNAEYDSLLGLKNMDVDVTREDAIWPFRGVPNADSVDWRTKAGVVTPVKDQGQCGSCWAFSATEAVESAYVIAGNEQVIMAPQELVDCAKGMFSSHGCSGGWYYYAYKWLKNKKTMTEADYPYTSGAAGKETKCAYDEAKGVTNVSSYKQV